MSDTLPRIFAVLGLDYENIGPLVTLLDTESYDDALAAMLETQKFSDEEWKTAALTHHLIVAWRPDTAHTWLTTVTTRLCGESGYVRLGLCQGTVVGLLEAGVWLDKGLYQTEFQSSLLMKLVHLICYCKTRKPMRLPHGGRDVDYAGLNKRLVEALNTFLFPEKTTHRLICEGEPAPAKPDLSEQEVKQQRAGQVKEAVRYLREHLGKNELNDAGKLFVERLSHSLLARMTPAEKVAAIHSIL